jgi:hypothetical protein
VRHHPVGLTLRKPDAILLSFVLYVGLLGGAVCTRTAGWRDLIGACTAAREFVYFASRSSAA